MPRVLVVDDEEPILELLSYTLEREGYTVALAASGEEALAKVREFNPELIILDLMLPGLDGLDVLRDLRSAGGKNHQAVRVILLTARSEEVDRIIGLELGADDYVTKPFSPRELVARVKAQFRRHEQGPGHAPGEDLVAGTLVLRPEYYEVTLDGRPINLAPKEFELLRVLMANPGKVLKRDYLLDVVWGYEFSADTRTVDVHIRYLRQKLEPDPSNPTFIETVRGVGYRFRREAVART